MSNAATSHVRVNRSLLAVVERRVLVWVAERLPTRIHSDHLTALSVVGTAVASLSFALARLFPVALLGVAVGLAINWFGDSLDGTLARVRRQERPRYGFYVDHVLDVVGATMLMGGMALSAFMTPLVALGAGVTHGPGHEAACREARSHLRVHWMNPASCPHCHSVSIGVAARPAAAPHASALISSHAPAVEFLFLPVCRLDGVPCIQHGIPPQRKPTRC